MPEQYVDEKGRKYHVERRACCASLGRVGQNVYVVYEDGSKAVISDIIQSRHSKLEQDAQTPTKCTEESIRDSLLDRHTRSQSNSAEQQELSLDETTKNSMSTHNFMQECYRHQPAR